MLDILSITGPIYIAILLGYLTTRLGMFTKADVRIVGKFVLNLALPALLFKTLSQRPLGEILNFSYLAAYVGGSLALVGLGYFWCRRFARLSRTASTIYVMGMSCSNSGFVGYPILLLSMAPVAGVSLALNMIVENLIVIPLLLVMAEGGHTNPGPWYQIVGQSLAKLIRTPLILGMIAGFIVSVMGWKLPETIARTVNIFALSSSAVSLFVIGGALVGLSVTEVGPKVVPIVTGKLILHPLAVLLASSTVPLLGLPAIEPSLRSAAVMMAAMPMMSIYTILAQMYGEEGYSAAAMLITTIASFFTLSGLLWVVRHISF